MPLIEQFDRSINNNPSDTKRLAFGDPNSPIENIELGNFYSLLATKIGLDEYALISSLNQLAEDLTFGLAAGSTFIGDFVSGYHKDTVINIGLTLSDTNYMVIGSLYDTNISADFAPGFVIIAKTNSTFTVRIAKTNIDHHMYNMRFEWQIRPLP